MQIGKIKTTNEYDGYVMKIAELRLELENLAKLVSKAQGDFDLALQGKQRADQEKKAVLTQIEDLKKDLADLEQLVLERGKKLADVVSDINNNLFNGDNAILKKQHIIETLNKEIAKFKEILGKYAGLKKEYAEQKELNDTLKFSNRQLVDENKKLDSEIKRKKEYQLQDLPYWKKLREDAEHLFLNASQKQEFVQMAVEQLKQFCEENNIPFSINFKSDEN